LVERVEGFATEAEWRRAYREINEFERVLTDSGVRVIKLFLHITADGVSRPCGPTRKGRASKAAPDQSPTVQTSKA
jgi:Polyphosphate kinase 2 (PPK2)